MKFWKTKSILFTFLFGVLALSSCGQEKAQEKEVTSYNYEVNKSEEEWKAQLSPIEYEVLREEGTERPFTGKYVDWKEKGTFVCKACQNPLFSSSTKFMSGTGWPSFYEPIKKESVLEKQDHSHGWNRIEVECARCGGHLGHVFEDGPEPTGLRYCINSVCLSFLPE